MRAWLAAGVCLLAVAGCERAIKSTADAAPSRDASVDAVAERYVKLALGAGVHDPDFVDAYFGPPEWRDEATEKKTSVPDLLAEAAALASLMDEAAADGVDAREEALSELIEAAATRLRIVSGEKLPFDEETRRLYDAVAPANRLESFDAALAEIEAIAPGEGPLADRVNAFRESLAVPSDKLGAVFDAAIAECRRRTLTRYRLPEGERFAVAYVTDKPWSGYNWYEGDWSSRIEINTDLPVFIDRAVDLGCHEGYPGHHVWNVFGERDFLKANGWIEYAVYPLFSPRSLIAEGSANYGIELAFPGEEKLRFERDVLYPLAGLDPSRAETLSKLNVAMLQLSHAGNHVARDYLDGRIDREKAIALLIKYTLVSRPRAEQRLRFIESYRGYVVNYNLGRDIVAAHIDREAAKGVDRWDAFEALLTTPLSAGDLSAAE